MHGFLQDAVYALRIFRRAPAFTAIVILTLALGIGANTAVFSILHAVLLAPLPYRDSSRLVAIWDHELHARGTSKLFDLYSDYENWKHDSRTLESVAAASWAPQASPGRIFSGRGPARSIMALPVTPEFFSLLGVEPMLGRVFGPADAGRGCRVVVSEEFWRSALAADAKIAGESIRLNREACTVLGVMPAGFAFLPPEAPVVMWTILPRPAHPDEMGVGVFARLRPGVRLAAAQAEILARHRQLHAHDRWGQLVDPVVYDLHGEFTWLTGRNLRLSLIVLFAAVSLVLLIGCVNVANLLLGRAAGRKREMAVRAALGSGRGRLVRQLLTESALLSLAASVAGALLAALAIHAFRLARPVEMPPGTVLALNAPVLAFTALLSILTAAASGLAPAWKASRTDLNEALKSGGRASSQDRGSRLWGKALIVAEVTLTVVLLAGAGLLIGTFRRFASAPLGFQPEGLATAGVPLPATGYADAGSRAHFYERLLASLDALPGIESAALSSALPILGGGSMDALAVEGRPAPADNSPLDTFQETVSADYFRAMETPLEQGRFFGPEDTDGAEPAAILNREAARQYFPHENPIGQRVRPLGAGSKAPWLRVVGVAGNQKRTTVYREMAWVDQPILYRAVSQNPLASLHLILRLRPGAGAVGAEIQRAVAAFDPEIPVGELQPGSQLERRALSYPRLRAILLGAFAALALILAIVGMFGVLSQVVAQRTHEIGVRMALGAPRGAVVGMILKQGLALAGAGALLGMGAAWMLGRYLESLLYGVRAAEPLLLAGAAAAIVAASLGAMYLPARRAARIDPLTALKYE